MWLRAVVRSPVRSTLLALLAMAGSTIALAPAYADCKPKRPLRPITLKTMGPCQFDAAALRFAGSPDDEAACLLRPVKRWGHLGPILDELPRVLANRVGRPMGLPSRDVLSAYLSKQNLETDFAAHLWQPISRANNNDPDAPAARYFVLHDTSGPIFNGPRWPSNIDFDRSINNLGGHRCDDGWERVHVVINRMGDMLLGHDFAVAWRATKFERATNFAGRLRGLFVHVEMVQPRRRGFRHGADILAPVPGFTQAQYEMLALVYVVASVRAERWLIPAFHAVIDSGIYNAHDDPQNFDLGAFARNIETVLKRLERAPEPAAMPKPPT